MSIFKKADPHREQLEARIAYIEDYIQQFAPETEEYDSIQQVLMRDYEELRKMDESKVKAKDILPWASLVVTVFAGVVVPVYGMNKAYKSEEVDGKLKNGTVFGMATKNMKH